MPTLVIGDIGSKGGDFLAEDHTMKFFRQEACFPKLIDHNNYSGWVKQGGKALDVRLKEKADEILATHKPEPIPTDALKRMDEVLKKL